MNQIDTLHNLHRVEQLAALLWSEKAKNADATLTLPQAIVLKAIDGSTGASQTDIVKATSIDRSTVADVVARMVRRNLVKRRRRNDDARTYELHLTQLGKEELDKAIKVAKTVSIALERSVAGVSTLQVADLGLLERAA